MKDFSHAVVRTIGEDGRSRTMLLDMDTAQQLTGATITQVVSTGGAGERIPDDIQQVLSWDLGGMKKALAEAESRGILTESSSMEDIQRYLDEYQDRHNLDFGLPRLV